jgi:anti-anti-sigma factor
VENEVFDVSTPILDFRNVKFIDSSGMGFILGLWRRLNKENKHLYLIEIRPSTRRFFELSRLMDVFKDRVFGSLEEAMNHLTAENRQLSFYFLAVPRRRGVMLRLYGALDAAQMQNLNMEEILPVFGDRNCLLDLENLNFVDSSGIVFFLKIQKHIQKTARNCVLFGLQNNVYQMFRITKLDRLFKIVAHLKSAERYLERVENGQASNGSN